MELKLNSEDYLRLSTGLKNRNFIDIECAKYQRCIRVQSLKRVQYIEVREKEGLLSIFYFESKRHKKEYNFEWWHNAKVIFSINEVEH